MNILEYNDVDHLQVLNLTMLALDFPFTPEHAAPIRRTDPRPFSCLTVHAVEDGRVLGQAGVFRLPMISIEGREHVGGIWAVATHPQHAGRGIASALLEEAHSRMRDAGLRFSTLGTDGYRRAHKLYRKQGYVDMNVRATALARWELAHQPTRLRARPASQEGFEFVEKIFSGLASQYLGFAWRHKPFARLRDKVHVDNIWILWEDREPVGYVFASRENLLLKINIQILRMDIDAAEVVAAVVSNLKASYVEVTMSRPSDIASFQRAGWQTAHPNWDAFMVKPLLPNLTVDDARRLLGDWHRSVPHLMAGYYMICEPSITASRHYLMRLNTGTEPSSRDHTHHERGSSLQIFCPSVRSQKLERAAAKEDSNDTGVS